MNRLRLRLCHLLCPSSHRLIEVGDVVTDPSMLLGDPIRGEVALAEMDDHIEGRLQDLREIDLSRGDKHTHPDIMPGRYYLARIYGAWHMGRFTSVWYGLNFSPWGNAGLQFDAPGYNSSAWERVIEVDFHEDAT